MDAAVAAAGAAGAYVHVSGAGVIFAATVHSYRAHGIIPQGRKAAADADAIAAIRRIYRGDFRDLVL